MTDNTTRTLVVEREMHHSAEKIWRALTQPALIADWLMENDFEPVQGHRFNLRTKPMPYWNGVLDCEVLTVEPYERLSYSWNTSGEEAGRLTTIVTFSLAPIPGGTLLRMEQSGFRIEDEDSYRGAGYGWQRFLDRLESVAAQQG